MSTFFIHHFSKNIVTRIIERTCNVRLPISYRAFEIENRSLFGWLLCVIRGWGVEAVEILKMTGLIKINGFVEV